MATPTIKSTYSLDVETVRTLEALAQRWNVSKSKALQRSILAAAQQQPLRTGKRWTPSTACKPP